MTVLSLEDFACFKKGQKLEVTETVDAIYKINDEYWSAKHFQVCPCSIDSSMPPVCQLLSLEGR